MSFYSLLTVAKVFKVQGSNDWIAERQLCVIAVNRATNS